MEQTGAKNIRDIQTFLVDDFLKSAVMRGGPFKEGDSHVLFSYGTLVRFNVPKDVPKAGWTFDAAKCFPSHRLVDQKELAVIAAQNQKVYDKAIATAAKFPKSPADMIKAAYYLLFEAGYPFPGTPLADSGSLEMAVRGDGKGEDAEEPSSDEELFGVVFQNLSRTILTLGIAPKQEDIPKLSLAIRENRRQDLMFPRPVAVIMSDLTVYELE